jgi:hypothetical protein
MLKILLILLLLVTPAYAGLPPTRILDEGSDQGLFFKLDCVGASVECTQSGITGTLTITSTSTGDSTVSGWTDQGAEVVLVGPTDEVTIGSTTKGGKLFVDGDQDQEQLKVQGNSTQTFDLAKFENSTSGPIVTISPTGLTSFVDIKGGGVVDATGIVANTSMRIPLGITQPACSDGEIFYDNDATSGQRFYICEENTFTLQGDGTGSGVTDATFFVTQAHGTLTDEAVLGTTPGGELDGSWTSPTVDTTHSGSAHHASPLDATFLVTQSHANLTDEAVVGLIPAGDLGGTWTAPTVDSDADWTDHNNYPAACSNQFVTTIGDTNTCASVAPAYVASGAYDLGTSMEADTITEGGTGVPNTGDKLDVFAATTSAELSTVLSDEDGTGECGANVYCIGGHEHEGSKILSTGEGGGTKFLREDGDGTSSWQTPSGSGVTDATFFVTQDHADLTDETIVGTTPGGHLEGTWTNPTVRSIFLRSNINDTHSAAITMTGAIIGVDAQVNTVYAYTGTTVNFTSNINVNTGGTSAIKFGTAATSDPCVSNFANAAGVIFYNSTDNDFCFCDGTDDVKMSDVTVACF